MAKKRPVHHFSRGLWHRVAGATAGALLAVLLVLGLSLSAALPTAQILVKRIGFVHVASGSFPAVASTISYGVYVPALQLSYFPSQKRVPIASITKMMTAYVALKALGKESPASKCYDVDATDVAAYHHEVATGQSTALIEIGQSICFDNLMKGLMIHSASDYALIFSRMFAQSPKAFVALMNKTAHHLGMKNTVYADPTGVNPANLSTPRDQLILARELMKFQLVRDAVKLPSINLPVAGNLNSFTPFAGSYNVIGVKSGRTDAAGGCDVMATNMDFRGKNYLALVAVFGARGGDLLKPAGQAALALSNAIPKLISVSTTSAKSQVGSIRWEGQEVGFHFLKAKTVYSWTFQGPSSTRAVMKRIDSALPAHSVIGQVYGPEGRVIGTLVTSKALHNPSLWQRIL